MAEKELVFMEHDGAIDDILSQLLLLTMTDKEVIGINVTPADSFIEPALESTYKVLQLLRKETIEIGRSEFYGINAFPGEWRARPEIINALPMLINLPPPPNPYNHVEASQFLIDKLVEADQRVHILITGPCSNLVNAVKTEPRIKEKIKRVIWMGGAFRTNGNVRAYQHNGTAEWNAYWDPKSSKALLEMNLPLTCISLDVTNKVPVTKEFLSKLAAQSDFQLSNLAGQLWALTIDTIPNYYYIYYMWDTLTTSYLAIPEAFTIEKVKACVSDRPPNAGQTYITDNGYELTIATDIDTNAFYAYILNQFKRNSLQLT
jgi:purine nucleosidase